MRGLSAAIQEGAQAYLRRQYTTIGIVGVVLFIALIPLQNIRVAIGFAIGGLLSASAGFIGIKGFLRPNAPVAQGGGPGLGPAAFGAVPGGGGSRLALGGPGALG